MGSPTAAARIGIFHSQGIGGLTHCPDTEFLVHRHFHVNGFRRCAIHSIIHNGVTLVTAVFFLGIHEDIVVGGYLPLFYTIVANTKTGALVGVHSLAIVQVGYVGGIKCHHHLVGRCPLESRLIGYCEINIAEIDGVLEIHIQCGVCSPGDAFKIFARTFDYQFGSRFEFVRQGDAHTDSVSKVFHARAAAEQLWMGYCTIFALIRGQLVAGGLIICNIARGN